MNVMIYLAKSNKIKIMLSAKKFQVRKQVTSTCVSSINSTYALD